MGPFAHIAILVNILDIVDRRPALEVETPGSRIRAKRIELGMSQETLARKAELTIHAINRIEVGLLKISTIADYLPKIADALGTAVDFLVDGELNSQRLTREELRRLRKEGYIRSDSELNQYDEFAMEALKLRRNANIPLTREEILFLIEVVRGSDGL